MIIPDSVTYIGLEAFYDCSKLERIYVPSSVEYIGGTAFFFCSNLKEICIDKEKDSIYGAPWCDSNVSIKWKGEF